MILSASGQILYVSDSIKDALEHCPHNIVGEYVHSLVHPDDHTELNQNLIKEPSFLPDSSCSQRRKRKCTREPTSSTVSYNPLDPPKLIGDPPDTPSFGVECGGTPHLPCGVQDLNDSHTNHNLRVLHPLSKTIRRRFFCRMKCMQHRKLKRLVKSWGYKTVHCSGYQMYDLKEGGVLSCKGFIGHVKPLQPPAIFEIPLVDGSFMTHHSLDLNYIFTDKRLQTALGYLPEEVLGQSMYNFVHDDDLYRLSRFHKNLLDKGECISGYYRLRSQAGPWLTLQSQANIVYNKKEHDTPDYIVSISYIIGQTSQHTDAVPAQRPAGATADTDTSISRANIVIETVPQPVQISELLDNGLFYTDMGEKALPSQITRVVQPAVHHTSAAPVHSYYPDSLSSLQQQYYAPIPPTQTYPNYARDLELSRDLLTRDVTQLSRDRVQHEITEITNTSCVGSRSAAQQQPYIPTSELLEGQYNVRSVPPPSYPVHHTICHLPRVVPAEFPQPSPHYSTNQPAFQYLHRNPAEIPSTPYIEHLHVGNYLRYLEDDHMYYDTNRVS